MSVYTVIKDEENEIICIYRVDESGAEWSIPTDPANSDYQRYLAWLENPEAEQSTPNLAADAD